MHIAIDILAAVFLLFFLLAGWHKGFLLSLLGMVRVVLAYGAAYFAGRYLGYWLGEIANRPRIVTIPVVAGLAFMFIAFFFHLIMSDMRTRHRIKEKEEDYRHPFISSLGGGAINLVAGLLSLALLFWLSDLFMVGVTGNSIPGSSKAYTDRFARRMVYEASLRIIPKTHSSQSEAMAHTISNPAAGMKILEEVVAADSMQQLASDPNLAADLLSGDAERVQQNPSIQQLFNDRAILENLRDLGMLSGNETKAGLCRKLAAAGQNEKIRASIESLKQRDLLHADKIPLIIRDPDFDVIISELLR